MRPARILRLIWGLCWGCASVAADTDPGQDPDHRGAWTEVVQDCAGGEIREPAGGVELPVPPIDPSCALPDLTGRHYRFRVFEVLRPEGPEGALASTLSALWEGQIARQELNIYFRIVRHDVRGGEMEVEAGTAFQDGDPEDRPKFRRMSDPPPGLLRWRLSGCSFQSEAPASLPVFPDLLSVPFDILGTEVTGAFLPDGTAIRGGWMAGGICRSMAERQWFRLVPGSEGCSLLSSFLDDLGVEPDRNDLGPCGCPPLGYQFVGTFEADQDDRFAAEPGVPVRTFRCP